MLQRVFPSLASSPATYRPGVVELAFFAKQLSALLRSGVTVGDGLLYLLEGASRPMQALILDVRRKVLTGIPFSRALAASGAFPPYFVGLVEVGERIGNLDQVLSRLAAFLVRERRFLGRVRSAMLYPAVVMALAFAVTYLLLATVVPQFARMASELDLSLPWVTRAVFALGEVVANPLFAAALLLLAAGGLWYLARRGALREVLPLLAQRVPALRSLYLNADLLRWTSMMALMKGSGMRVYEALGLSAALVSLPDLRAGIERARQKAALGIPLYVALEGVMPRLVLAMVRTGEESGEMDRLLEDTAQYYEEMLEESLERVASFVQPALLVVVGGIVFFILAAVFLPYGALLQAVQEMGR